MTDAEIERIIAERVMGWHKSLISPMWLTVEGGATEAQFNWHPLTDPAQALRALEAFCKAHPDVEVALGYDLGTGWSAGFLAHNVDTEPWGADDASFPRAVCAALVEAVQ